MKIIPKITGKEKILTLSEGVKFSLEPEKVKPIGDQISAFKEKGFNKENGDEIDGTALVDESIDINEMSKDDLDKMADGRTYASSDSYPKTQDEPYSWIELFRDKLIEEIPLTRPPASKVWRQSPHMKGDIYNTAENIPITADDFDYIRELYTNDRDTYLIHDKAIYLIAKNATARRSEMDKETVEALIAWAVELGEIGFKSIEKIKRTLDPKLIAEYLKKGQISQTKTTVINPTGRKSAAATRDNIAQEEERMSGIKRALNNEISSLKMGKEKSNSFTETIMKFIQENQVGRKSDDGTKKDFVPVNDLLTYAVLVNDVELARECFSFENAQVNLNTQGRIGGKFDKILGRKLLEFAQKNKSTEMVNLLLDKGVKIGYSENKNTYNNMKTIIITERQAQILSLMRLDENSAASVTKEKHGYTTPKNADYVGDLATGPDYEKQLRDKRKATPDRARNVKTAYSQSPAKIKGSLSVDGSAKKGAGDPVKATANQFVSPSSSKKSLSVDGHQGKVDVLSQYFVKEGIEEYRVTTKKDILAQLVG